MEGIYGVIPDLSTAVTSACSERNGVNRVRIFPFADLLLLQVCHTQQLLKEYSESLPIDSFNQTLCLGYGSIVKHLLWKKWWLFHNPGCFPFFFFFLIPAEGNYLDKYLTLMRMHEPIAPLIWFLALGCWSRNSLTLGGLVSRFLTFPESLYCR